MQSKRLPCSLLGRSSQQALKLRSSLAPASDNFPFGPFRQKGTSPYVKALASGICLPTRSVAWPAFLMATRSISGTASELQPDAPVSAGMSRNVGARQRGNSEAHQRVGAGDTTVRHWLVPAAPHFTTGALTARPRLRSCDFARGRAIAPTWRRPKRARRSAQALVSVRRKAACRLASPRCRPLPLA